MHKLIILISLAVVAKCCNESNCGSVVTKCLLTQSCSCDFKNPTCFKECFNCLGFLYTECCSCLDLCPKADYQLDKLNQKSHIEEFKETSPGLFDILTEYPDDLDRWVSKTFPYKVDLSAYQPKKQIKIYMQSSKEVEVPNDQILSLNCTVVFWSQCMSWAKCKNSCHSMGASSLRWFHDGCCECVGQTCINYGLNESSCTKCPEDTKSGDVEFDENTDYGETEYDEYADSD